MSQRILDVQVRSPRMASPGVEPAGCELMRYLVALTAACLLSSPVSGQREPTDGPAPSGDRRADGPSRKGDSPAAGYPLMAISAEDGVFERITVEGREVYQTRKNAGGDYSPYLYFRVPDDVRNVGKPVYIEVAFRDHGAGRLRMEYNAPDEPYRQAEGGYGRELAGGGAYRTAVFRLDAPAFRRAQNAQSDLRLSGPGPKAALQVAGVTLFLTPSPHYQRLAAKPWLAPYKGPTRLDVNAKTLRNRVLCGYQGWFRCPGDGTEGGWGHWSRDPSRIAPDTLTFEMWPDLSEFAAEETYPAPGFTYPNGKPASLFSSANPRTVERHFDWMQTYKIDGVLVQRFVTGLEDPAEASRVLGYVRAAANRTGRVFAVEYDMTGMPADRLYERVTGDWKWLTDEMKITQDPRYLHHNGKPVLAVWGFFSDRFDAALAHRLIDFFKDHPKYSVTLVGGCPWSWRAEKDPSWARAYRRFDVISPWNVGNVTRDRGKTLAATAHWAADLAEAKRAGRLFMPVIYPGFSWDNLQRKPPGSTTIARLGGEFYWDQFAAAARLGVATAKVAMFDEVDEGTAIFKVRNAPPRPGHFATFEGHPSDWYLRLTGEGSRLLRKERPYTPAIPLRP